MRKNKCFLRYLSWTDAIQHTDQWLIIRSFHLAWKPPSNSLWRRDHLFQHWNFLNCHTEQTVCVLLFSDLSLIFWTLIIHQRFIVVSCQKIKMLISNVIHIYLLILRHKKTFLLNNEICQIISELTEVRSNREKYIFFAIWLDYTMNKSFFYMVYSEMF